MMQNTMLTAILPNECYSHFSNILNAGLFLLVHPIIYRPVHMSLYTTEQKIVWKKYNGLTLHCISALCWAYSAQFYRRGL